MCGGDLWMQVHPLWDVGVWGVGMLVYRYKMSGVASHQILMVVWN